MCEINEIGSRLRELREASDYTVERLAAELRVDPEVYRNYEQDGKDIPIMKWPTNLGWTSPRS